MYRLQTWLFYRCSILLFQLGGWNFRGSNSRSLELKTWIADDFLDTKNH